ncbi:MAG TPA: hypothetical protein PK514_09115 [Spirochaetota bacterium]|nr:hypothetical protein [Spirochaetota bacterium]
MKKVLAAVSLAMCLIAGCSGMQIREAGSVADEEYLKDTIGGAAVIFKSMDESLFNYNIMVLKNLLKNNSKIRPAERETRMKNLETAKYAPDTYFYFEIRHIKPYNFGNGVTITFIDSAGKTLIDELMYDSGMYGDGINSYICIVKSKKAVTRNNFKEGELPVIFTAEFLKQKKQYFIFPE